MGAKLQKYIKQNINSYFKENQDGTVTVSFGGDPLTLGSSSANFLKQIITKQLNGGKNRISPPDASVDMVDQLNTIAKEMIKKTKLTPYQEKELQMDTIVKKIK